MGTVTSMRGRRGQRGAIAIVVGISIVTLVLMIGLVLDLSHLFIVKHELQNAADACALAGARELPDITPGALERATGAAVTAGTHNRAQLQHDAVAVDGLREVKFSDTFAGPYEHALTANTKYVRCSPHETEPKSVAMWFMQLAGIFEKTLSAEAVAKVDENEAHCAIPLAMCTSGAGEDLVIGTWYYGRTSPGESVTPGMYEWITFEDSGPGTSQMKEYLEGNGYCGAPKEVHRGKAGMDASVRAAWNTRFGVYGFGYKLADVATYRPDLTGYAYLTASSNVYPSFLDHRRTYDEYNGDLSGGHSQKITSDDHREYGKGRRVVTVPIVRCQDVQSNKEVPPIVKWGCALMLAPIWKDTDIVKLEFLGLEGTAACASGTGPGTGPLLVK